MIGPNNTSLLHKFGKLMAWEMPQAELEELVEKDQFRRTTQRALGRVTRQMKGHSIKQPSLMRLEQLGLADELIARLRASGVDESTLIQKIRKAGLL